MSAIYSPTLDKLLLEPNLLIPGKKPVGSVGVDWSQSLSRDLIDMFVIQCDARSILHQINLADTSSGITVAPGAEGMQLASNGTAGYAYTANDAAIRNQLTDKLTVVLDIEILNNTASSNFIFGNTSVTAGDYNWGLYLSGGNDKPTFYVKNTSATVKAAIGSSIVVGTGRIQLAGVYDGSFVRIYVDGVEDGAPVAQTGNIQANDLSLTIDAWNGHQIDFILHNIAIYNRALSSSDLRELKKDPYQILTPTTRAVYLPATSAGGVSIPKSQKLFLGLGLRL